MPKAQRKSEGTNASDRAQPDRANGNSDEELETQTQTYRKRRRQRLQAQLRTDRYLGLPSAEVEIIDFARIWVPFGGPPADEIFVRFGMSRNQFTMRLWRIVAQVGSDPDIAHQLRVAYSPRQETPRE